MPKVKDADDDAWAVEAKAYNANDDELIDFVIFDPVKLTLDFRPSIKQIGDYEIRLTITD